MTKQWFAVVVVAVFATAFCQPGFADSVLFNDLGPSSSPYIQTGSAPGTGVYGDFTLYPAPGQEVADLFTISGSGSEAVSQIDLGVQYITAEGRTTTNTFQAGIYTDNSGVPGSQVANATWSLTGSATCCSLVSITGITGVTLTGGSQYFMVLAPLTFDEDSSWNVWELDGQGLGGLVEDFSEGTGWTDVDPEDPTDPSLNAFDVLGSTTGDGTGTTGVAPEPSSLLLLGTGAAMACLVRRRPAANIRG